LRIRLGLPPENPLVIDTEDSLDVAIPELDMEESVRRGLLFRLDLQNTRDRVDDSRRALRNARNDLMPDLNLNASMNAITDPDLTRSGLQFDLDETDFQASVTYGLPLDRETERIDLRRAVISLERSERNLRESEDEVSLSVRRAIRDIQLARFSLNLQEESIRIIERRLEALEIQKERGTVNARTIIDAQDELEQALQSREQELRNVRVAVMRFLLETGQFRVAPHGEILLPPDLRPSDVERERRDALGLGEQDGDAADLLEEREPDESDGAVGDEPTEDDEDAGGGE
jgi:outer membrane protein TolC